MILLWSINIKIITTKNENPKTPYENHGNHENLKIPLENKGNHEDLRIPYEN